MSGSENGPSGGLWDTLTANSGTVRSFVTDPSGFILGIVIPSLISMLIITPTEYLIGFIAAGANIVGNGLADAQSSIAEALEPAEAAILGSSSSDGVIDMAFGGVESTLTSAGLGAPFAATLTVVVFASILTVLVYVLIRVAVDAVPGGGGLLP